MPTLISGPSGWQWMAIGNIVQVFGQVHIGADAAFGATEFRATLPVATNHTTADELVGFGKDRSGTQPEFVGIESTATTSAIAVFKMQNPGGMAFNMNFSFSYQIVV